MKYAGFGRRTGALFVDFLVGLPFIVVALAMFERSTSGALVSLVVPGILFSFYPIVFHARWGQTLGKMVMRIKVVRVSGKRIDLRAAFMRGSVDLGLWLIYAGVTASALASWSGPEWSTMTSIEQRAELAARTSVYAAYDVVAQIWVTSEVIVMLFNEKRRALHDFIAGTVVIHVERPSKVTPPDAKGARRATNA